MENCGEKEMSKIECACRSHDRFDCIRLRLNPMNQPIDIDQDDSCECHCHDWGDEDDQD